MSKKDFTVGEYCFCWYWNNDVPREVELFHCKIISLGEEYATCELYNGEELNTKRVRGTFKDVCIDDLMKP